MILSRRVAGVGVGVGVGVPPADAEMPAPTAPSDEKEKEKRPASAPFKRDAFLLVLVLVVAVADLSSRAALRRRGGRQGTPPRRAAADDADAGDGGEDDVNVNADADDADADAAFSRGAAAMSPLDVSLYAAAAARGERLPPASKCSKTFLIVHVGKEGGLERNACNARPGKSLLPEDNEGGGCLYNCEALRIPPPPPLVGWDGGAGGWKAPKYMESFGFEIRLQREPEDGYRLGGDDRGDAVESSFVGLIIKWGSPLEASPSARQSLCSDEFLTRRLVIEGSRGEWVGPWRDSRVLCMSSPLTGDSVTASESESIVAGERSRRWGIEALSPGDIVAAREGKATGSLDDIIRHTDYAEEMKDAVFFVDDEHPFSSAPDGGGEESATEDRMLAIMGSLTVLARTRYVEFPSSCDGGGARESLRTVVGELDRLGLTCYFRGRGRADVSEEPAGEGLFRLTNCYQDLYDSQPGTVACASRSLAPKLAARMERTFLQTVVADSDIRAKMMKDIRAAFKKGVHGTKIRIDKKVSQYEEGQWAQLD